MALYDYQEETILKLRSSLRSGKKRPVVQMPTGAGKTIVAAAIVRMAQEKGSRVTFVVPALSLIDQTVERFRQNGIYSVGVIQANHEMTDRRQPIQVASVQTLMRREIPQSEIVIIDEAHVMFEFYQRWFSLPEWRDIPIIGLTATPWAKGMALLWDDLIVGTTTSELIEKGHLSDFKVFAPSHPDLRGVKTVAGDYEIKGLSKAMDKAPLVADIVSTWLDRGENRPTICFAVNRVHAKHIQKEFEAAGISADYIDAFTEREDRNQIAKRFASGEVKVVCNVGVLTTGVDWDVRCIILARPTKSEILYTQMIGRGLRKAQGKDLCLILDHSDTTLKLGFVTDIHHDELDDGKKTSAAKKEREEPLPKECIKCHFLKPPKVHECPNCGFKPEPRSTIEVVDGELMEITRDKKVKKIEYTVEQKSLFYRELIRYSQDKGYKPGWAYWKYKEKFGIAPANGMSKVPSQFVSPSTISWITYTNIKNAKRRYNASSPDTSKRSLEVAATRILAAAGNSQG